MSPRALRALGLLCVWFAASYAVLAALGPVLAKATEDEAGALSPAVRARLGGGAGPLGAELTLAKAAAGAAAGAALLVAARPRAHDGDA